MQGNAIVYQDVDGTPQLKMFMSDGKLTYSLWNGTGYDAPIDLTPSSSETGIT